MKNIILVFVVIFVIGCVEQNDGVKVIENYDAKYLTDEQVDSEPGDEAEFEKLSNDLKQIVAEAAKDFETPLKTYLSYSFYVNESGYVDGVKELPMPEKYLTGEDKYIILDSETLTEKIAKAAESWRFIPAMKNGEPVKFRGNMEIIISVDENGQVTEEIPSLKSMASGLSKLAEGLSKLKFGNEDEYFVAVEEQTSPVGGLEAIQEKIKYPEKAKLNGIQGRVFVKAYINEKGNVDQVELLKGIDAECDSAAMEAVKQTKFTPGKQRGEPVKVQVSIPIVFKLQ